MGFIGSITQALLELRSGSWGKRLGHMHDIAGWSIVPVTRSLSRSVLASEEQDRTVLICGDANPACRARHLSTQEIILSRVEKPPACLREFRSFSGAFADVNTRQNAERPKSLKLPSGASRRIQNAK